MSDTSKKSNSQSTENTIENPGALQGSATMSIHTHECNRLVRGRKKKKIEGTKGKKKKHSEGIVGLLGFSRAIKPILTASAADDPYADMYLLKIDEAIESSSQRINAFYDDVLEALSKRSQLSYQEATSSKPKLVPLTFANTYGYLGADLLADYDRLVRAVKTAKHVGRIKPKQAYAMIEAGAGFIRSTFTLPTTYKYFAITREDVVQGTKRVNDAKAHMGELDKDVLTGKARSENAPAIRAHGMSSEDDDKMELNDDIQLEVAAG